MKILFISILPTPPTSPLVGVGVAVDSALGASDAATLLLMFESAAVNLLILH
jgi:hypothetical protein